MNLGTSATTEIEKLNILSPNRLAQILGIDVAKLVEVARYADTYYRPFDTTGRERPFQRQPKKTRTIDNPRGDLKKIQRRICRRLLGSICFPPHVFGGIEKRSVLDNASFHLRSSLLVTIDVRKCFPSISNIHVYHLWQNVLGCSNPVAKLLTRLTTFKRRLPQGSPASPLLANLFIWSIDGPIRAACVERKVLYSTWIDDLAFSGTQSRDLIQIAAGVLANHGLRLSHKKIEIMGPRDTKLLTGTRLGVQQVRASKEKLSRIRSGIHKLRMGMVKTSRRKKYIEGLIGQLRYIDHLCPQDKSKYTAALADLTRKDDLSPAAKNYLNGIT